jgi:two-component system, NtrC family, response regulator HydG
MESRREVAKHTVLVVDDHLEMARVLAEQLIASGYGALVASSTAEAMELCRRAMPDVVLTDLRMEKADGLDLLMQLKAADPRVPVLIMTAFGAVDTAVEAIKAGAFHYLAKPLKLKEMLLWVERAIAFRALSEEAQALRQQVAEKSGLGQLLGKSPPMRRLFEQIQRLAHAPVPVLIRGESGTGKELVARALHFEGPRRDKPFVPVNAPRVWP